MAATTSIDQKETTSLIGSDKVEGTAVYGPDRGKIGSLERVMIDKLSGKVAYAVLSFGGFLGMGEDYYPVPWSTLTYDTDLGGYRVSFTKDQLEQAPKYSESQGWNWSRENTAAFTRTTKPTPTGNEATKNYWRVHLGAPDSPAMKEKTHGSKIFSGRK